MERIFRLLFLVIAVATVTRCFPSGADESSEEVNKDGRMYISPSRSMAFDKPSFDMSDSSDYGDGSMEDGFYLNPFRANPFNGFYSRMQNMMNRLKEQMAQVLTRVPEQGIVGPWGNIPDGANTTSTKTIINGHVVTVNETTYTGGDDDDSTVFRVRIIDVKPQEETTDLPEATTGDLAPEATTIIPGQNEDPSTTPRPRSVETVEELDNEIPKSQVDTLDA